MGIYRSVKSVRNDAQEFCWRNVVGIDLEPTLVGGAVVMTLKIEFSIAVLKENAAYCHPYFNRYVILDISSQYVVGRKLRTNPPSDVHAKPLSVVCTFRPCNRCGC